MPDYKITADIFTLPYKNDQSVLYAPIQGFVCVVNDDFLNLLADLDDLNKDEIPGEYKQVINFLIEKGLVNGIPDDYPQVNNSNELKPSKIALFPTSNCNLSCRYCYAAENKGSIKQMELKTAKSAIEYFINVMKKEKLNVFPLEFHGGGEPFCAWTLVQKIIKYAQKRCKEEDFQFKAYSATNGVLNNSQLQWTIKNFSGLLVSFDGLPNVQDYHREMSNHTGSFDFVNRTLQFFDEHNFPYGIRCTVSKFNEDLLDETVDFISKNYKTKLLLFEPVNICGKIVGSDLKPNLKKFIANFKKLEPICVSHGIRLEYSGAQFEKITPTFCYVGTDNFAVTPEGYLTNCWEVTSKDHPHADTFIFGRMLENGKIAVDYNKLNFLRSLSVNSLDYCKDCFAKWHCAGDCVMRIGHSQFSGDRGGERCQTNREIIAYRIVQMLERKDFYQKT